MIGSRLGDSRSHHVGISYRSNLLESQLLRNTIEASKQRVEQTDHFGRLQVVTKRSQRLLDQSPRLTWPANVWMGVSVENEDYLFRADHLRRCGAKVKFLSCEPLLGPLQDLDLNGIDWVIVGGESGPGARPMDPVWVRQIRDHCRVCGVPFFFKQWGGVFKKRRGRLLDGRTWEEMPEDTRHPAPTRS